MPPIDPASIAAMRAALAAARTKPDALRVAALSAVLDDLLTALAASGQPAEAGLTVDAMGDVIIRGQQKITLTTGLAAMTLTAQGDVAIKGHSVTAKTTSDVPKAGNKIMDGARIPRQVTIGGARIGSN